MEDKEDQIYYIDKSKKDRFLYINVYTNTHWKKVEHLYVKI